MSFDQLLIVGESKTLEVKTNFNKTSVESLVSLVIAKGGTKLVGVSNAGLIHGATSDKEMLK